MTFSPELRQRAEELVGRYPMGRSALLPLLHLVQHVDGHISHEGVAECAELLGLTKAEVGAVATFYTMYKREPLGEHLVSVCTNFSCKVRGAQDVYDRLSAKLGVGHNGTTSDGRFTLEHAECLGNCEGAPVLTIDYLNYECVSPDDAEALLDRVAAGEVPPPTRGMVPPGIKAVQHRLAGLGPSDGDLGAAVDQARADDAGIPAPEAGPGAEPVSVEAEVAPAAAEGPADAPVQPEFRDDAGEGDLGAEETGPEGLEPESGAGGGDEYPLAGGGVSSERPARAPQATQREEGEQH